MAESTSESTQTHYTTALDTALQQFKSHLSNPNSKSWKPIPFTSPLTTSNSTSTTTSTSTTEKGKSKETFSNSGSSTGGVGNWSLGNIDPSSLTLAKKKGKSRFELDIIRATVELNLNSNESFKALLLQEEEQEGTRGKGWLEDFMAVLRTSEVRNGWDKLVEKSSDIELLNSSTRISKTDYKLGWPASPRDTITINKTYSDSTTLISLSTSLPRSNDEPAFLRPAPPYVRSHVHLLAWCIQLVPSTSTTIVSPSPSSPSTSTSTLPTAVSSPTRIKITLFWQWSLSSSSSSSSFSTSSSARNPLFPLSSSTYQAQIPSLLIQFIDFVKTKGDYIPLLGEYGEGIDLEGENFDEEGEMMGVGYSVVFVPGSTSSRTDGKDEGSEMNMEGVEGSEVVNRKVKTDAEVEDETTLEILLSPKHGWDLKLLIKSPSSSSSSAEDVIPQGWKPYASIPNDGSGRISFRITHDKLKDLNSLVKVNLTVQRLAGGKGIRMNSQSVEIHPKQLGQRQRSLQENEKPMVKQILDDAASIAPSLTDSLNPNSSSISLSSSPLSSHLPSLPASRATHHTATQEINALLRRNYIYFTSLLQEPEAKWRHISDSSSVTITQLDSIDPTLTIYRAEATIVGVGVWDVFSTICTPGARMYWDKTLEEAVLLEDISELSSLWWIRGKASWPVAPRDSVTVRTVYKSPSSVHIFSFSSDNTNLFPSIPPPSLPTIRTQTDLYGWAIEALSPTTTQITLLDQSDPKGWSNKNWTPGLLINALAGVRDFSIKFGGPPVLTRLEGRKVKVSRYDHEKGLLKLEYQGVYSGIGISTLEEDDDKDNVGGRGGGRGERRGDGNLVNTIECEIRCDCNTWAQSIDIIIDPPPNKVSCLSRHRLSSGGGLWITIEHDSIVVGDEKLLVIVKRGPSGSGREKGSVTVNGSRVKVDVEQIEAGEVNLLSKKKRVKASPIPLDQYSTHGPKVSRSTLSPSSLTTSSIASTGTSTQKVTPLPSPPAKIVEDPFKSFVPSQISPLVSSVLPSAIVSSPITPEISTLPLPPPPLPPPAQALEALSWLQTFHAEQGPELADPAPGWAIHSERAGTVVRKKIIPSVSEVLPVYRGDRIVQGLTADEIASVVSAVGCRKSWDERVESAIPLTTYGYGCSTAVLTTKPSFPFKGRIFHLASVNAQVRVPSASAASSTSTVVFCATSSFTPDESFDKSRVNPGGLLSGKVLLEGWILETLDPYASSLFTIPSTRCTYVTCVDHSGSVPLALNSVLNANLARLIGSVESLGKTKGPLPRLWTPDSGLQIEGPLNDDGDQECVWNLTNLDPSSVLLSTDFEVEDRTFRSLFKISAPTISTSTPPPQTPPRATSPIPSVLRTPGKSTALPPMPSHPVGTIFQSDLPRSTSLNFGSPPPKSLMVNTSSTTSKAIIRKASSNSLREKRSNSPTKLLEAKHSHDLVVAELIVDLKQFPHGYSIACSSSLISLDPTEPLSLEPLVSLAARQIPLRATAHVAPLPSIVSASLDSWKRTNHLVRILVPTSAITHPILDPLREGGKSKTTGSIPDWFKRLVERGAIVDVRIVPLPADPTTVTSKDVSGTNTTRVMFNGEKMIVASQVESKAVLSRIEDDEDWHFNGAKISRVTRKKKSITNVVEESTIPLPLQAPVAVAVRLLAPKMDMSPYDDLEFPDPKSPGSVTPNDEERARSPSVGGSKSKISPAISGRRDTVSIDSGNGPLLSLLGAYPLSRLSSTMTTTSPVTDDPSTSARRTYTLSFVILVTIISFLLGSLLRSLLTPADYIIYPTVGAQGGEVEKVLMQAFDPKRRYREAIRLLEVRSFFFSKWDLIFAAVKR